MLTEPTVIYNVVASAYQNGRMKPSCTESLRQLYDRFNARDIEAVLAMLHPDVTWANGMEGGHVHGREEVRAYWMRQWSMIDPHLYPMGFSIDVDRRTEVDVHQIVRDFKGDVLADKQVRHIFQFDDSLIKRFDIG